MSQWHRASRENIDLDLESKEVDILVVQSYQGNVYLSLTFDQIKKLYAEIMELEAIRQRVEGG